MTTHLSAPPGGRLPVGCRGCPVPSSSHRWHCPASGRPWPGPPSPPAAEETCEQDLPASLLGTEFPLRGFSFRLFLPVSRKPCLPPSRLTQATPNAPLSSETHQALGREVSAKDRLRPRFALKMDINTHGPTASDARFCGGGSVRVSGGRLAKARPRDPSLSLTSVSTSSHACGAWCRRERQAARRSLRPARGEPAQGTTHPCGRVRASPPPFPGLKFPSSPSQHPAPPGGWGGPGGQPFPPPLPSLPSCPPSSSPPPLSPLLSLPCHLPSPATCPPKVLPGPRLLLSGTDSRTSPQVSAPTPQGQRCPDPPLLCCQPCS